MEVSPTRDPSLSLFVVAVALILASVSLREVHGVKLSYDALAFVWFSSWFAGALSVVASLIDAARSRRRRSLYFAVVVVAGHVLGFHAEMDESVTSVLATILWALLAVVVTTEAWALMRPSPAYGDGDLE